ncbi:hypothetical protein D9757_009989 [Collybiopsis confluens]|uniref:Cytochrome b561 domain-containing protein n=1 Tax=Collybiopsis confluens TaxID=2823264 RepID=A0A8H5GUR3_9AGAR|nr:hypothetical protein D9757_009989 [Collybiopsis confluens]
MSTVTFSIPLTPPEVLAKRHAILVTIGFLILLPIGALIPRYTRTFTPAWFPAHFAIQLFLSGPIIFAGWYYGYQTSDILQLGHFYDPHQKMGLTLLILYCVQLALGLFTHFIKLRSPFGPGTRAPQNYFHVFLGLVILVLAAEQVHYGLYIEWETNLAGLHNIPMSAKHAWIALIVIFWVLYLVGLALVPRQFTQERNSRHGGHDTPTKSEQIGLRDSNGQSGV